MDAGALADGIEADLRAIGSADRAANEKRYLKSDLEFHGATMRQMEAVIREFAREHRDLDRDGLEALVVALWARPVHERRMAAVMLLKRFRRLLSPEDLPLVERLIRESKTWAYVDALAADVAGRIGRDSVAANAAFDRWATDPDFWLRRSALLPQLRPVRDGAALDRFAAYADAMLEENEFFVRKAIGWVMREAGKRRPAEVVAWLEPRTQRASGVTMREAVKYLPAADAARLMAAYRGKRPAV